MESSIEREMLDLIRAGDAEGVPARYLRDVLAESVSGFLVEEDRSGRLCSRTGPPPPESWRWDRVAVIRRATDDAVDTFVRAFVMRDGWYPPPSGNLRSECNRLALEHFAREYSAYRTAAP